MERLRYWLKLLSTANIGHNTAVKIVNQLGDPQTFLNHQDNDALKQKFYDCNLISSAAKNQLLDNNDPPHWHQIKGLMRDLNISYVTILDHDYPTLLKNIYDPPPILFHRGKLSPGRLIRNVAVVGTRKPSGYGKMMAHKLTDDLAKTGLNIVSGLAAGIDTIAHKAALDAGKPTIAVLGTAIDYIYPSVNRGLADDIIANGCLISENPPGIKTEKWSFPARNRIISGLCSGVLVIEGALKSGAMLTAKFALEQNRDLFALPGDVNRDKAQGPNRLIKLGAKLVSGASDILEEYDLQMDLTEKMLPELSQDEELVFRLLQESKPEITMDKLLIKSTMDISKLSTTLLTLELKGLIKKNPGNKILPLF